MGDDVTEERESGVTGTSHAEEESEVGIGVKDVDRRRAGLE